MSSSWTEGEIQKGHSQWREEMKNYRAAKGHMIFWELQETFGKVADEEKKAREILQKCLIMLKSWTSVLTEGGRPGEWRDHWKDVESNGEDGRKDKTEGKGPNQTRQSRYDLMAYVIMVTQFITNDH